MFVSVKIMGKKVKRKNNFKHQGGITFFDAEIVSNFMHE